MADRRITGLLTWSPLALGAAIGGILVLCAAPHTLHLLERRATGCERAAPPADWDAAPITWATHRRVRVYPVTPCGAALCPFDIHYISTWYTPHPGLPPS